MYLDRVVPKLTDPSCLPCEQVKRDICPEYFLWELNPPHLVLVGDTLEYEVEEILWQQGKAARRWHFDVVERASTHQRLLGSLNPT